MDAQTADVLFCTDAFLLERGDELRRVAPELPIVVLDGDRPVSQEDIDRITIAFFSHDAWPERAASFMTVALGASRLRWFHTMSAGVDHPVFGSMVERGVRLTTSSGASARPIARTAMMYLLALSRDLPRMLGAQAAREWSWDHWDELEGRRVAVLGYGPIGQEVIRLAAAFGMEPVIVRRAVRGDEPHPTRRLDELTEIATSVDVMVTALPLTDDTRGIISRTVFDALPCHALFVNVGRGELVDQPALTDALVSGSIAGAGIDVTDPEPLPSGDPLWAAPNLILTPHNSGSTDGTGRRAADMFLGNLGRWLVGDPLANEVGR